MLCENCNKNEATIYYTQTINGNHTEQHLCDECASQLGVTSFSNQSSFMNQDSTLGSLLSTILGFPSGYTGTKPSTKTTLKCDNCGMTYEEFLQRGKFGCSDCINSFTPEIDNSLKRIHGFDTHTGKRPINYQPDSQDTPDIDIGNVNSGTGDNTSVEDIEEINDVTKLQTELKKAVKEEKYEEAAKLRDRIKDLNTEKEDKKKEEEDK